MRPAITAEHRTPTSFAPRFLRHDPSRAIREITKALTGIWSKEQPRSPRVASKRAKVMNGQADPIGYAYTITIGALDEGKSFEVATAWVKDLLTFAEQYAARRPMQGSGILAFRQVMGRLTAKGCLEQGEADAAIATLDENDVASIDRAMAQLIEEIESDELKLDRLRQRKAELLLVAR